MIYRIIKILYKSKP